MCYYIQDLNLIGVHEIHVDGRMHPSEGLISDLLVHSPLSSLSILSRKVWLLGDGQQWWMHAHELIVRIGSGIANNFL